MGADVTILYSICSWTVHGHHNENMTVRVAIGTRTRIAIEICHMNVDNEIESIRAMPHTSGNTPMNCFATLIAPGGLGPEA